MSQEPPIQDATDEPTTDAPPGLEATDAAPPEKPSKMGWQAKVGVALVALCALLALFWPRGDGTFEAPGGYLVDGGGRPALLGSRMEPITLVHFWATWCPPCLVEIPALQRLHEELINEPDFGLLMVAVSDDTDKVKPFVGSLEPLVLYDHDWDVAHRYGTRKLPETYLVVGGQVVEKYIGAQNWDDPDIRAPIFEALAARRGPRSAPAGM